MASHDPRDPSRPDPGAPRYAGIASLLRAPLAASARGLDIALLGIPYDGALTNRAGARHAPREVRNASTMMRAVHHVTGCAPQQSARIGDLGDVPLEQVFDIERSHEAIASFLRDVVEAGALPLSVGGDHSVTLPILRAVAARSGPVGLIQVDAHTDTWDAFQGSKFSHGSPIRRAHEEGLIDAARTVQIGIRGAQNSPEGWDYSRAAGMRLVFIEELRARGIEAVAQEARALVGQGPVYLTFDIDALDPVYAPGTGTPEIGGLTSFEAQQLVRALGGLNLVGADLVEVSPPFDSGQLTTLTAATLLFEILCILCEALPAR